MVRVSTHEGGRETQKFEFNLSHQDIVDLMNDPDVNLDGGKVLDKQIFQVLRRKRAGAEVDLYTLFEENDKIVFRFKKVIITDVRQQQLSLESGTTDTEYPDSFDLDIKEGT